VRRSCEEHRLIMFF